MTNFYHRIAEAAARFPDRTAIEIVRADRLEPTSYASLLAEASRMTGWLSAHGVARGDRAAILADNDARWIAAYLATLGLGAVAVPLDTAYKADQVRTILASSGARVVFTTLKYLETARRAVTPTDQTAGATILLLSGTADDVESADGLVGDGPPQAIVAVEPADAAVMLYTSGTTADPKGVVLTHANLEAERGAAFAILDVSERDAVLGVLPLFHALAQMANLLLPLAVGARVVFLETVSSSALLEALASRKITIFACVPQFFYLIHQRVTDEVSRAGWLSRTLFRVLLAVNFWLREHTRWNPGRRWFARVHRALGPTMRLLVTGGSRFDPGIGRDLYALGFALLNGYGLTETTGAATIIRPGDRFTTSVGQPLPGVEIRIAPRKAATDADGDEGHDHGEILIRGPIVMREYFNRPDATRETLKDGWLYTGDLGHLDADGRLYITGRAKELIVLSSGKNLYPEEIEAHYRKSAFIKELCVLGRSRPGEPSAERLHAVIVPDDVVLREKGIVNVRELVRFELETLSVQLPAHKRILSYDIWLEPLPRTTTGKIRRHEIERRLREREAAATVAADTTPVSEAERHWLRDPTRAASMAVIATRLNRPSVRPDANLELDLGLDSMERVELLTSLEQRQGTRVSADARAAIFTIRQLVEAVIAGAATDIGYRYPMSTSGIDTRYRSDDGGAELPWDTLLSEADAGLVANLKRSKRIRAVVLFFVIRALGLVARVLLGFRSRGQTNLPKSGPFIICPNHQSYLDGFFLAAALPLRTVRQLFFVGATEYFETPLMRWLAQSINVVPVDPDANLVTAMSAGAAGLRLGKVLILFPEGERTIDGELKLFRKGAAILSSHLGAPIVPVALEGLFPLWPRGRGLNWRGLLPWRAARVSLVFGAPLPVARGAYSQGTAALKSAVAALLAEVRAQAD